MSYGYKCVNCGLTAKESNKEQDDPLQRVYICDHCGTDEVGSGFASSPIGWFHVVKVLNDEDSFDSTDYKDYCSTACLLFDAPDYVPPTSATSESVGVNAGTGTRAPLTLDDN